MDGALATLSQGFDYAGIESADAKALKGHARKVASIQERVRKTAAEGLLAVGAELDIANAILAKAGSGTFQKWCKCECGISHGTAQRALVVYRVFGVRPNLGRTMDATPMCLLASESCPDAARAEALELAESGEHITAKVARELIAKHSGEPEEAPWCFDDAFGRIRSSIERVQETWPDDKRQSLANILRNFADQIEKHGGLLE